MKLDRRQIGGALGGLFPLLLLFTLAIGACTPAGSAASVEIEIRYSHFNPPRITVPHGKAVTFVLVNDDPIDHEWIVGNDEIHRAHRTGTELYHASRPTEVTIPALTTRRTTVTLPSAATLTYICHLPGHEAYGMIGTLEVT
jgi:uncharacterized cupredoxin-like copper-binding protein